MDRRAWARGKPQTLRPLDPRQVVGAPEPCGSHRKGNCSSGERPAANNSIPLDIDRTENRKPTTEYSAPKAEMDEANKRLSLSLLANLHMQPGLQLQLRLAAWASLFTYLLAIGACVRGCELRTMTTMSKSWPLCLADPPIPVTGMHCNKTSHQLQGKHSCMQLSVLQDFLRVQPNKRPSSDWSTEMALLAFDISRVHRPSRAAYTAYVRCDTFRSLPIWSFPIATPRVGG